MDNKTVTARQQEHGDAALLTHGENCDAVDLRLSLGLPLLHGVLSTRLVPLNIYVMCTCACLNVPVHMHRHPAGAASPLWLVWWSVQHGAKLTTGAYEHFSKHGISVYPQQIRSCLNPAAACGGAQ